MNRSLEEKLSAVYLSNIDIITEGLPEELNARRRECLESINLSDIPSTDSEQYRHTDLRAILSEETEFYFSPGGSPPCDPTVGFSEPYYSISLINGFCGGKLERTPQGMVYGSLRQALAEGAVRAGALGSAADYASDIPAALNGLFVQDGAVVCIPDNTIIDRPLIINSVYRSDDKCRIVFPRILIIAGKNSRAQIIFRHKNIDRSRIIIDSVKEVILEEGASIETAQICEINGSSVFLDGNYSSYEKNSNAEMTEFWAECGKTRVNYGCNLNGKGAVSTLHALYLTNENERADINMKVKHNVPDCTSYEMVKGVASGNSVGAFTGIVYVAEDAQGTSALQQNRNILLSECARVYAEPQLEIYADDVKCSHGATVGQMDSDAVYYMRQRGISEQEAKRLQMFGFINDIVTRCRIESACAGIGEIVENRIKTL